MLSCLFVIFFFHEKRFLNHQVIQAFIEMYWIYTLFIQTFVNMFAWFEHYVLHVKALVHTFLSPKSVCTSVYIHCFIVTCITIECMNSISLCSIDSGKLNILGPVISYTSYQFLFHLSHTYRSTIHAQWSISCNTLNSSHGMENSLALLLLIQSDNMLVWYSFSAF